MNSYCPFCGITKHDEKRIIKENDLAFVVRDGFPISEGHTLIIPKRHVSSFFEITNEEHQALMALLEHAQKVLNQEFKPDAYNIGINDGVEAGQTVPHLHIHLIPRYDGDVKDPRGGVRWVIPEKADYWSGNT